MTQCLFMQQGGKETFKHNKNEKGKDWESANSQPFLKFIFHLQLELMSPSANKQHSS